MKVLGEFLFRSAAYFLVWIVLGIFEFKPSATGSASEPRLFEEQT